MQRTRYFLGNWKMNMLPHEVAAFTTELASLLPANSPAYGSAKIGVAAPFTSISVLSKSLESLPVMAGAQNVHWLEFGPHTGEISASMLREAGAEFVIVGHSERRLSYGETSAAVSQRAQAALLSGLHAVICVGETREEYECGATETVVSTQLRASLAGIDHAHLSRIVIAYEPVWAIGTGLAATPQIAQSVHRHLRLILDELFGIEAEKISIIYGGSTTPDNIAGLMAIPEIDGALPGGASLKASTFSQLIINGLST